MPNNETISPLEFVARARQRDGEQFTVVFEKKDGDVRIMRAGLKTDHDGDLKQVIEDQKNMILTVWDYDRTSYRRINLQTLMFADFGRGTVAIA